MDDFWGSRRILVTGGTGFLGSYIVEKLRRRCVQEVFAPTEVRRLGSRQHRVRG